MLEDCLESGRTFGVVAIKQGREVGPDATPCQVGTLARIVSVEKLDDGRINLIITGASRFRVLRQVPGKPYVQAEVDYLEEEDPPPDGDLSRRVKRAFESYIAGLRTLPPISPPCRRSPARMRSSATSSRRWWRPPWTPGSVCWKRPRPPRGWRWSSRSCVSRPTWFAARCCRRQCSRGPSPGTDPRPAVPLPELDDQPRRARQVVHGEVRGARGGQFQAHRRRTGGGHRGHRPGSREGAGDGGVDRGPA